MKLVTVQEMQAIEREADARGLSYAEMMQNAGKSLAEIIDKRFSKTEPKTIVGLVGPGNNGGDTLIALAHLQKKGWETCAFMVKKRSGEDAQEKALLDAGGKIIHGYEEAGKNIKGIISDAAILLDGVLGTGITLPLRENVSKVLKAIQKLEDLPTIVAVDCPSGVDCDSGEMAKETLTADLTVCMAAVKKGLLKQPAFGKCGEITVADIGIAKSNKAAKSIRNYCADADMSRGFLPARPMDSHKGSFGKVVIAGGSINYCGAVILAAKAAYRVGAGLVTCAIPGAIYDAIAGTIPEATWLVLPHSMGILNGDSAGLVRENVRDAEVLIIGPGLGDTKDSLAFVEKVITADGERKSKGTLGFTQSSEWKAVRRKAQGLPPLVIDADGIRQLAKIEKWHAKLDSVSVITPHPGEMAALTGLKVSQIQNDRESVARKYAQKWGHVVVLKGAITVIASPDGECTFIPIATAALATAGTGDVLAGMIGGLIAQGLDTYEAAVAGAFLHGKAGMLAAGKAGQTFSVMAIDVADQIGPVIKQITGTT